LELPNLILIILILGNKIVCKAPPKYTSFLKGNLKFPREWTEVIQKRGNNPFLTCRRFYPILLLSLNLGKGIAQGQCLDDCPLGTRSSQTDSTSPYF